MLFISVILHQSIMFTDRSNRPGLYFKVKDSRAFKCELLKKSLQTTDPGLFDCMCAAGVDPSWPVHHRDGDLSVPGSLSRHSPPANVLLLQGSKRRHVCNTRIHTRQLAFSAF